MKFGTMRRTVLSVMFAGSLLTPVVASAAVQNDYWKIPANVRIAQKDNVDNVKSFQTIQAAVNDIIQKGSPSEVNPYVVMVMPGTFAESVTLPSYISLRGSGLGNTIISGGSSNDATLTIQGGAKASVEELTLAYSGATSRGNVVMAEVSAEVHFKNVHISMPNNKYFPALKAAYGGAAITLDRCLITLKGGTASGTDVGIDSQGPPNQQLALINTRIEMETGTSNVAVAVLGDGFSATRVVNTDMILSSTAGNIEAFDTSNAPTYIDNSRISITIPESSSYYGMSGLFKINNSTITTSGGSSNVMRSYGGTSLISNSTIKGDKGAIKLNSGAEIAINNSVISGLTSGITGGKFSIGNSQLVGGHDAIQGEDMVVNCIDGNFNPIPNVLSTQP